MSATRILLVALLLACSGQQAAADALSLTAAYDAALTGNARYLGRRAARDASAETVRIARADLLPRVDLGYSLRRLDGERSLLASRAASRGTPIDSTSEQFVVQLRQPLFDTGALLAFLGARAAHAGVEREVAAARSELALFVVRAYLDLALAEAELTRVRRSHEAYTQLLVMARARAEAGEGTLDEVAEARAKALESEARLRGARREQAVARAALALLTGDEAPNALPIVRAPSVPHSPEPLLHWLEAMREGAPAVQAARHQLFAAAHRLRQAQAGHLPTVDAVIGWNSASSDSLATLDQRFDYYSAGIQIDVPLFAGGALGARSRQAAAEREAAAQALADTEQRHSLEVERAWLRHRDAGDAVRDAVLIAAARGDVWRARQTAYLAGELALGEVLEATERRDAAEFARLTALVEAVDARAALLAASSGIRRRDLVELEASFDTAPVNEHASPRPP